MHGTIGRSQHLVEPGCVIEMSNGERFTVLSNSGGNLVFAATWRQRIRNWFVRLFT